MPFRPRAMPYFCRFGGKRIKDHCRRGRDGPFADGFDVAMHVAECCDADTEERLFSRRGIKDSSFTNRREHGSEWRWLELPFTCLSLFRNTIRHLLAIHNIITR